MNDLINSGCIIGSPPEIVTIEVPRSGKLVETRFYDLDIDWLRRVIVFVAISTRELQRRMKSNVQERGACEIKARVIKLASHFQF